MPNELQLNDDGVDNLQPSQPIQPPLGKGQKIAAASLAVFAIFVISLWFVQFKKSISSPFAYQEESESQSAEQEQSDNEAMLKSKDSDNDGLSDWDELYVYKTSPYLEDSDSDGFSDKEEIDSGKDPNCPAGRTCGEVKTETGSNASSNSSDESGTGSSLNTGQIGAETNGSNLSEEGAKNILEGQSDADALRQMLLDAGMDKNILDKISDEDLMKSYAEVLKQ